MVKNPPANAGDMKPEFDPRVGKIPWRRAWQPTPVFLLGESHAQRSLVGYSPEGHKEPDMTEVTWHTHTHMHNDKGIDLTIRYNNSKSIYAPNIGVPNTKSKS